MGDGPVDMLLASAESGKGGEHSGEVRVTLSPAEEYRFSFEKLNPRSYPNSAEDTLDEGGGRCEL